MTFIPKLGKHTGTSETFTRSFKVFATIIGKGFRHRYVRTFIDLYRCHVIHIKL